MIFEKLHIIASDSHGYFRDKLLWSGIFKFIKEITPNTLNYNGDMIDWHSCSRFPKTIEDTKRCDDIQFEVDDHNNFLAETRLNYPIGVINYTEGNHELRYEHYLTTNANKLRNLRCLQFDKLLKFDKFRINYHKGIFELIKGRFILTHGTRYGVNSSRLTALDYGVDGVIGHGHKRNQVDIPLFNKNLKFFALGHTADKTQIDYAKARMWNQSILLIIETRKNLYYEHIECENGKFYCKYTNKEYQK